MSSVFRVGTPSLQAILSLQLVYRSKKTIIHKRWQRLISPRILRTKQRLFDEKLALGCVFHP